MLFERVPELKAKWPKGKTIDLDVILADSPDVLKEKLYADFEESLTVIFHLLMIQYVSQINYTLVIDPGSLWLVMHRVYRLQSLK